jgi:hypothetical protein
MSHSYSGLRETIGSLIKKNILIVFTTEISPMIFCGNLW